MFLIYLGDILIGRSELEHGDPPMGVAHGAFVPADVFESFRNKMEVRDADTRILAGLKLIAPDETAIDCRSVVVIELGEVDEPFAWEVECIGFEDPKYETLFPHHVKTYLDQFKG